MPQKKSGGTRGHKCVAGRLTSFGHSPLSIGLPRDLYKLPVVFHIARDGSKTKLDEMHFIANEISLRSTDVEARRDMLDVKFSERVSLLHCYSLAFCSKLKLVLMSESLVDYV